MLNLSITVEVHQNHLVQLLLFLDQGLLLLMVRFPSWLYMQSFLDSVKEEKVPTDCRQNREILKFQNFK